MRALVLILGMTWTAILLSSTVLAAQESPAPTVTILVRSDAKITGLTRERIIDLLTGRVTTLADGGRVVLVLSYSPDGEAAIRDLTARDLTRLMRGWKRLVFGGGSSLPLTADSNQEAIEMVRHTTNGILPLVNVDLEKIPEGLQAIPISSAP